MFVKSLALKYRYAIGYICRMQLKLPFSLTKYFIMRCRRVYKMSPSHISHTIRETANYVTVIILLVISISSTFRPPQGALDCVYSLCYKAPMMLPAGD